MKLVFLHNQRAGGTSIKAALRTLYKPDEVAPVIDNSPAERYPERWADFASYNFAAGHFGYEVVLSAWPNAALVTNFRDPVDRVVSLYNYWQTVPLKWIPAEWDGKSGPHYAQSLSLAEFVRSKDAYLSLYLDNWHTRQMLCSGWLPQKITPGHFLKACARIARMRWYYICERPEQSLEWLAEAIPEVTASAIEKLNAAPSRSKASEKDRKVIAARNKWDIRLYRFATAYLLSRLWKAPRKQKDNSLSLIRRLAARTLRPVASIMYPKFDQRVSDNWHVRHLQNEIRALHSEIEDLRRSVEEIRIDSYFQNASSTPSASEK